MTSSEPMLSQAVNGPSSSLRDEDKMTADQMLSYFGSRNKFLFSIFASMSAVWGLAAMPMMATAFFLGKFDLHGDRAYLVDLTTMAFLVGNAVGSSVVNHCSDTKGRRPVLAASLFVLGLAGTLSALSTNIFMFALCRLIQGFCFAGCVILNWVLAYECAPRTLRPYAALVFGLAWVAGYCALAPLDMAFGSWRPFMVASSVPSAFYAVGVQLWAPESLHYLVTRGRKEEVVHFVNRCNQSSIYRVDPSELDHFFEAEQHDFEEEVHRNNHSAIAELKKQKILIVYTLIIGYLWTCDAFIYYGLSLFSTELAGNRYVNYVLLGLIEAPSYLVSPYGLQVLGRRWFVSLNHMITALSFLGIIVVGGEHITLLFWLSGKFGVACALTALFVYGTEIFPTTVRTGCIGFCSTLGRTGGALAPSARILAFVHPQLPNFLFVIMATVAGLLTLTLPETANRELPDEAQRSDD